jgi:hypothetical protein
MTVQERIDYLTTMAADIIVQLTELDAPQEQIERAEAVSAAQCPEDGAAKDN